MKKLIFAVIIILILVVGWIYWKQGATGKVSDPFGDIISRQERGKDIFIRFSGSIDTHIATGILDNTFFPLFSGINTQLSGSMQGNTLSSWIQDYSLSHQISSDPILVLHQEFSLLSASGLYLQIHKQFSNADLQQFPTLFLWEKFIKNYEKKRIGLPPTNNDMIDTLRQSVSIEKSGNQIFIHYQTGQLVFEATLSLITNTSRKKSFDLDAHVRYTESISGTINLDLTVTPVEKKGITAPEQYVSWEKIMKILEKK